MIFLSLDMIDQATLHTKLIRKFILNWEKKLTTSTMISFQVKKKFRIKNSMSSALLHKICQSKENKNFKNCKFIHTKKIQHYRHFKIKILSTYYPLSPSNIIQCGKNSIPWHPKIKSFKTREKTLKKTNFTRNFW